MISFKYVRFSFEREFVVSARPSKAFTLLELLVVVGVIAILVALAAMAVRGAWQRARAMSCQNNLRQIGLAVGAYESAYGLFPFGVGADSDTDVSRHVSPRARRFAIHSQLLPYLEQEEVYSQINFLHPPITRDPGTLQPIEGANDTAALTTLSAFLCPSDRDRMAAWPWGKNSYRSCNGTSWSGRGADGLFSQISSIRAGQVLDGLSFTAAFSERIRGDGSTDIDMQADVYRSPTIPWEEAPFLEWCKRLTKSEAAGLFHDYNGGMSWIEGNMNWTRYNHALTPGSPACKMQLTWDGAAMTANSNHGRLTHVLLGDGSVRAVDYSVNERAWRALGTIAGGERVDASDF